MSLSQIDIDSLRSSIACTLHKLYGIADGPAQEQELSDSVFLAQRLAVCNSSQHTAEVIGLIANSFNQCLLDSELFVSTLYTCSPELSLALIWQLHLSSIINFDSWLSLHAAHDSLAALTTSFCLLFPTSTDIYGELTGICHHVIHLSYGQANNGSPAAAISRSLLERVFFLSNTTSIPKHLPLSLIDLSRNLGSDVCKRTLCGFFAAFVGNCLFDCQTSCAKPAHLTDPQNSNDPFPCSGSAKINCAKHYITTAPSVSVASVSSNAVAKLSFLSAPVPVTGNFAANGNLTSDISAENITALLLTRFAQELSPVR